MKSKWIFVILMLFCHSYLFAQSQLVKNLKSGKTQTLVVYGTSISSMRPNGPLWVKEVEEEFNKKYDNRLTVLNTGKSGQNSVWALKNLADSVLSKKPDTVILEFATNDAVTRFNISLEDCRENTEVLIKRIKEQLPECEILLHSVCGHPLGKNAENRPEMKAYNNVYRTIAKKQKLRYINTAEIFSRIAEEQGVPELRKFAGDGVHPTKKGGLEIIAPNVIRGLEKK